MKCPYCDSENIHVEKQGFGFGKSLIGGILLGPLGLFCGAINKNKLICTCLKCARSFGIDEGINAERKSLVKDIIVETDNEDDILYKKALILVQTSNTVSTSYIQRELRIGYNKAASLIDRMEKECIISVPDKLGHRQVL